jgi:hypothetical protein
MYSNLHDTDAVMARLNDAWPDFDPQAWIAHPPPMDQYGALLFQIGGQQLSVAPLGGHSSASRLFLAVTFPREPELHADPRGLRHVGLS